jgi:hypothetical protein
MITASRITSGDKSNRRNGLGTLVMQPAYPVSVSSLWIWSDSTTGTAPLAPTLFAPPILTSAAAIAAVACSFFLPLILKERIVEHVPHPHIEKRRQNAKATGETASGFNNWLAVKITNVVGTMWCAYAFTIIALISLPDAIKGGRSTLVAWIAQTFLQLVLLSIIMVGQKVAAAGSDKQAQQTYEDAEALLQINDEMHKLLKQNTTLTEQIDELLRRTRSNDEAVPR